MASSSTDTLPWEQLAEIIDSGNAEHLEAFVHLLPPSDTAYTINRLDEEHQTKLLSTVTPELAAQLMDHLADAQVADLIEELPPKGAAAIVDEMDSDDQADVLWELDDDDAEAILKHMDPAEAKDARRLVRYDPGTAGGIMISEYLCYNTTQAVGDVLQDLRDHAEEYNEYDVQYVYTVDQTGRLRGLIKIRDVVLRPSTTSLESIMIKDPVSILTDDHIKDLEDVFDHHSFNAIPVVDSEQRLVGVVRRDAVEEAHGEQADRTLLRVSGLIAGEELRSMAVGSRSIRRLAYLVPNILLMVISVSVIAAFKDIVLKDVIALAVFLPLVAGVAGSAANQAVAVSIRELSLGLAKPNDGFRVLLKESQVGVINGLVLGVLGLGVAYLMEGNFYLALAVASAIPLTVLFSVILGGTGPLILRGLNVDPAMASGPIITTLIDFFGFFLVLGIAWLMLDLLKT